MLVVRIYGCGGFIVRGMCILFLLLKRKFMVVGCLCGWLLFIVRKVFVVGWVFMVVDMLFMVVCC